MQSMNKSEVKKQIKKSIIFDKYELPSILLKDMQIEIVNVIKKYIKLNDNAFRFAVKIIDGERYKIEFECMSDGFFIRQNNIT